MSHFDTVYFCGENIFKRIRVQPDTTDDGVINRHLDDLQHADLAFRVTETSLRFLKSRDFSNDAIVTTKRTIRTALIGFCLSMTKVEPKEVEDRVNQLMESLF